MFSANPFSNLLCAKWMMNAYSIRLSQITCKPIFQEIGTASAPSIHCYVGHPQIKLSMKKNHSVLTLRFQILSIFDVLCAMHTVCHLNICFGNFKHLKKYGVIELNNLLNKNSISLKLKVQVICQSYYNGFDESHRLESNHFFGCLVVCWSLTLVNETSTTNRCFHWSCVSMPYYAYSIPIRTVKPVHTNYKARLLIISEYKHNLC